MDVLIVGAGVMGCAVGWTLARAGVAVQVLERAIPGAEASSAAAGILAPLAEASGNVPLRELGRASLDRYPAWADALRELTGIDIGLRRCGLLHVALDEPGARSHDAMADALGDLGERLEGGALRTRWPWLGPGVRDGLWIPTEAQVDNRELVRALHAAAARAGVSFVTGRTVQGLVVENGRTVGVRTDTGELRADEVVVCAGAWTSRVPELAHLGVRPIRGQMLTLKVAEPPFQPIVFAAGRGYLVPRADGRVLVGSTMEDVGFEKAVTAAGLRHLTTLVADVTPGLLQAPVVDQWAGFRPAPTDDVPLIGRVAPGLWVASGHFRNGILLTPITAELLAAQMLGRTPPADPTPFDPTRAPR